MCPVSCTALQTSSEADRSSDGQYALPFSRSFQSDRRNGTPGYADQDLDLVAGGLQGVQQLEDVLVAPRFEVEFHLGGVDRDVLGGAVVLDCVDVGPVVRQQVDQVLEGAGAILQDGPDSSESSRKSAGEKESAKPLAEREIMCRARDYVGNR